MTCPYIIYGAHSTYCGYCHKAPSRCTCPGLGASKTITAFAECSSSGAATYTQCPACGALTWIAEKHDCPVSLPIQPVASAALMEETQVGVSLRALLIAARVGVVEWRGAAYALTWWED